MFAKKLSKLLVKFDYKQALKLSNEIHEYECRGKEITQYEDQLWSELTYKIMKYEGHELL